MRRLVIVIAICAARECADAIAERPSSGLARDRNATFPNTQVGSTSAAQSFTTSKTTRTIGDHLETSRSRTTVPTSRSRRSAVRSTTSCQNLGCGEDEEVPCIEPTGGILCVPDETFTFTAVFHPTVAALVTCSVTISDDSAGLQLSGTGTAPPIHVTASPTSIAFGGVRTGTTSSAVNVTVTNSGGSPATISSVTVAGTGYAIASGTSTSHTLAANSSELHGVTCSPGGTVGALGAGTLTINSNDPTTPTINVGLSCSGITSKIAVTPSPIAMTTTRVGEPVMQSITIQNTGAASATIDDVLVTGMTMVSAPAGEHAAGRERVDDPPDLVRCLGGRQRDRQPPHRHRHHAARHPDHRAGARHVDVADARQAVDFGPICVGQAKLQMFDVVANQAGAFKLTAVSQPMRRSLYDADASGIGARRRGKYRVASA